jgi:hypothetical protein
MRSVCFQLASADPDGNVMQIWLWIGVLMAVVVLGGLLVVIIRKRAQHAGIARPALGLSLADLRQMKADGRLSEAEFERAKAMVIGELGGKVDRPGGERIRVEGRIVDGELRARAGYDLTGQPLPDFGGSDNSGSVGGDQVERPNQD